MNYKFGEYLRKIRQTRKISLREIATAFSQTHTYISDIENGNNKPPDRELLEQIITALGINDNSNLKNTLYDLAAKERNDVPADIKDYIMKSKTLVKIIRKLKENPNRENILDAVNKNI